MARERSDSSHIRPVRRLLLAVLFLCLAVMVLIWRIDNPRVERLRSAITDRIVPNLEWVMAPITAFGRMVDDFQSYTRL
jgi:rod shape-determining protein MreC